MPPPSAAPPRPASRWWALPVGVLTAGLAVVTWGAVGAFLADPGFVQGLRLVIEALATGLLAVATWRLARGRWETGGSAGPR